MASAGAVVVTSAHANASSSAVPDDCPMLDLDLDHDGATTSPQITAEPEAAMEVVQETADVDDLPRFDFDSMDVVTSTSN